MTLSPLQNKSYNKLNVFDNISSAILKSFEPDEYKIYCFYDVKLRIISDQ